jgi:two-component system NtrC family sensor kinase
MTEGESMKAEERPSDPARLSALRRIPLRTRLILAFVVLIISSASATIMIGNTVFGRKFDEIASDLVTLNARLASHVIDLRLERMRLAAQKIAAQSAGAAPLALKGLAAEEVPLDFILLLRSENVSVLVQFPFDARATARKPEAVIYPAGSSWRIVPQSLLPVLEKALNDNAPVSGLAATSGLEVNELTGRSREGDCLLAVAAAPPAKPGDYAVLLGCVLNGRTELLKQLQRLILGERKESLILSIYLGNYPIAALNEKGSIHADAVSRTAETMFLRGEPLDRAATVRGEGFNAAFVPLRDATGRAIGMLGVANSEDAVADVRKRTILLFSSLIAGGMVFGFIMTFLFSRWLVSPISRLAEGMSRVADGDLNYRVRIESEDELGKLAGAFNQTVRAVKERDLKLREMTDSRLTQVEKQVSIGRLAAGVAHEINNPLTAILTLSSLWLRKIPRDDPRRGDLEIVVAETARCREIVRSLLDFARERPMEKHEVDVNGLVRETVLLAKKYEAMSIAKIELQLCAVPLLVNADAKLLQQVLMNLLLNAAEASQRGGAVRVETDEDSSGHFAQVKVVDKGKGIRKEDIDRVFEPFFTTKGAGKGTGLGLSVSLGIVRKHEGTIEIESREGEGTTVTVLLPRIEGVAS